MDARVCGSGVGGPGSVKTPCGDGQQVVAVQKQEEARRDPRRVNFVGQGSHGELWLTGLLRQSHLALLRHLSPFLSFSSVYESTVTRAPQQPLNADVVAQGDVFTPSSRDVVLRLHADAPHEFCPVLVGTGGANIRALQDRFGVRITAKYVLHDMRANGLLEVVGLDHAAVRTCTEVIDRALAAFFVKRPALGQIEPLAWVAAPHAARLWTGPDPPLPPLVSPSPSADDGVLRLHALCPSSFISVIYGACGLRVKALQRKFGNVNVTAGIKLQRSPLGEPVRRGATPLEVAGPDHAAVRACAAEIDERYGDFVSSAASNAQVAAEIAAGAPQALEWVPMPHEARLWRGGFGVRNEAVRGGGGEGAVEQQQAPDGALRLHARCAPGFAAALAAHGGEGTTALQHAFTGVRVCGSEQQQLIEAAGRAEDVVRACAAEVGRRHVDANRGRELQWHAVPIEARLWKGALDVPSGVGGAGSGDGSAYHSTEEKPFRRVHGGGSANGARRAEEEKPQPQPQRQPQPQLQSPAGAEPRA